jgi:Phosphopantothenate-cysteine ligase (EC 6.3.2.5)/Phosphopantothenoylcysteine decarboxylase (EC 4.1.1.36)
MMNSALKDKNIIIGISGGIAAYKAADLTSRLIKEGARVKVVMTENALKFIAPLTFETLSGNPVYYNTFQRTERWEIGHISLAKWADVMVVVPATANIIAKAAVWTG